MIPPRLTRATVQARINPNTTRTLRDQQRRDQILDAALALLITQPRHTITIATLAMGMILSPATIRRHFLDIDSIVAEILQNHLRAIIKTIGEIPKHCENLSQKRRKAYLAATRTPWGNFTDTHALLLREAQSLPEDLASAITQMRVSIGYTLAGDRGHDMLQMLDTAWANHALIEPMCAAIETTAQQSLPDPPAPAPAENPASAAPIKPGALPPSSVSAGVSAGVSGNVRAGYIPTIHLTAEMLGFKAPPFPQATPAIDPPPTPGETPPCPPQPCKNTWTTQPAPSPPPASSPPPAKPACYSPTTSTSPPTHQFRPIPHSTPLAISPPTPP